MIPPGIFLNAENSRADSAERVGARREIRDFDFHAYFIKLSVKITRRDTPTSIADFSDNQSSTVFYFFSNKSDPYIV